jgi:hypothetical protein
LTLMSGRFVV